MSQIESAFEDCVPFSNDGSLVLSLGYLVTTCIFLPFGRYQLKEAIGIQIFSFVFFFTIMAVFHYELWGRGTQYTLPWMGDDIWEVAGKK